MQTIHSETRRSETLLITRSDIEELLESKGIARETVKSISLEIPRGGDYSGMTLEIEEFKGGGIFVTTE